VRPVRGHRPRLQHNFKLRMANGAGQANRKSAGQPALASTADRQEVRPGGSRRMRKNRKIAKRAENEGFFAYFDRCSLRISGSVVVRVDQKIAVARVRLGGLGGFRGPADSRRLEGCDNGSGGCGKPGHAVDGDKSDVLTLYSCGT
jgi:hypothetical protein